MECDFNLLCYELLIFFKNYNYFKSFFKHLKIYILKNILRYFLYVL